MTKTNQIQSPKSQFGIWNLILFSPLAAAGSFHSLPQRILLRLPVWLVLRGLPGGNTEKVFLTVFCNCDWWLLATFFWLPAIAYNGTSAYPTLIAKEMAMRGRILSPLSTISYGSNTNDKTGHTYYYDFSVGLPILFTVGFGCIFLIRSFISKPPVLKNQIPASPAGRQIQISNQIPASPAGRQNSKYTKFSILSFGLFWYLSFELWNYILAYSLPPLLYLANYSSSWFGKGLND